MELPIRCEHPVLLVGLLFIVGLALVYRLQWYRPPTYVYSLTHFFVTKTKPSFIPHLFFALRATVLLLLAFLIARLQYADSRTYVTVDGIDIMVALDVSGSMQYQDFDDDDRSRIDVAKTEAIRFIDKRHNDAIGVAIFGNDALSRCPLTLDKSLLKDVVEELHVGIIDPQGTVLARGIISAANRLKRATGKTKIMIVLTDGEPTENDLRLDKALALAKELDIKIYTIGIGSDQQRMMRHPFYGFVPLQGVNKELLTKIARETGGQYFLAKNAADMRRVYDEIDQLETTSHEAPVFTHWYDLYLPVIVGILILICIEIVCATYVWRLL